MTGDPVTVRHAARQLGLSPRTVQADVKAGCPGIVRPGEVGRGNGALLDLDEYRRWRCGDQDDGRLWRLLLSAAAATFRDYGGVTRQSRERAAEVLLRLLLRYHVSAFGCDPDDPPAEMRMMLRVLQDCGRLPDTELD